MAAARLEITGADGPQAGAARSEREWADSTGWKSTKARDRLRLRERPQAVLSAVDDKLAGEHQACGYVSQDDAL